jgi:hypothetical protein
MGETAGECAWALWRAPSGGVGFGGAYRIADGGSARAILGAYEALVSRLGRLLGHALGVDEALSARLTPSLRTLELAGESVTLVEITPTWPASAQAERRLFEALFGPQVTLATAFVGERALFALGSDWYDRLMVMLSVAHGERTSSLLDDAAFSEALGFRRQGRVSLTWVETRRMALIAGQLLETTQELTPLERHGLATTLSSLSGGAIVSTSNAEGRRFALTTHLPPSSLQGATRLSGALWRVALSPFVSPPTFPPLPLLPPQVTPPVPASVAPPSLE